MVDHDPWVGDNPYFLLIQSLEPNEGGAFGHLVLDVDKSGWQVEYKDWLDRSAEWYLCEKQPPNRAVLAQIVYRGEHPYYLKRHIGQVRLNDSASRSIIIHGIGKRVPAAYETWTEEDRDARGEVTLKKRRKLTRPERTERLWLLPGNVVCGGEDMEKLAMNVVMALEWQQEQQVDQAAQIENPVIVDGEAVEIEPERPRQGPINRHEHRKRE